MSALLRFAVILPALPALLAVAEAGWTVTLLAVAAMTLARLSVGLR